MHPDLPWPGSSFCSMSRSMLGQQAMAALARDPGGRASNQNQMECGEAT